MRPSLAWSSPICLAMPGLPKPGCAGAVPAVHDVPPEPGAGCRLCSEDAAGACCLFACSACCSCDSLPMDADTPPRRFDTSVSQSSAASWPFCLPPHLPLTVHVPAKRPVLNTRCSRSCRASHCSSWPAASVNRLRMSFGGAEAPSAAELAAVVAAAAAVGAAVARRAWGEWAAQATPQRRGAPAPLCSPPLPAPQR